MNARRKKTGARVASARKAAPARQPAARSSASKAASAKKSAPANAGSAKRPTKISGRGGKAQGATHAKSRATVLGPDCTIEHAPALHQQLAKVLSNRDCVTLDFSAVKRCDTAGLQMLAAFLRERREAGLAVELTGTSENFLTTAGVLGLAALFATDSGEDGTAPEAGVA